MEFYSDSIFLLRKILFNSSVIEFFFDGLFYFIQTLLMKCIEMPVRPSPTESATKFSLGVKKRGNDGNMWVIVQTTAGVKRWKKVSSSRKSSRTSSRRTSSRQTSSRKTFRKTTKKKSQTDPSKTHPSKTDPSKPKKVSGFDLYSAEYNNEFRMSVKSRSDTVLSEKQLEKKVSEQLMEFWNREAERITEKYELQADAINKTNGFPEDNVAKLRLIEFERKQAIKNALITEFTANNSLHLPLKMIGRYEIDDNGSPYVVKVYKNMIVIHSYIDDDNSDWNNSDENYERLYTITDFHECYIASDPNGNVGHTILIELPRDGKLHRYIYVCRGITYFANTDVISDLIYQNRNAALSVAYGKKFLYFLLEDMYMDRKLFKNNKNYKNKDAFELYQDIWDWENGNQQHMLNMMILHNENNF